MTKIDMKKRGISSVLGTLLIVLVTSTAGVGAYVFANSMQGNLELSSGASQTREQLSIENAKLTDNGTVNTLTLDVRNSGAVQVNINATYVDGVKQTTGVTFPTNPVNVGDLVQITVSPIDGATAIYTPGTAHSVKITTQTGAIFTGTVIKETS